jgi:hypothetical protein
MIPNVPFDIDQNGNVRRADEAEALFCAINLSWIITDEVFRDEVLEIAKKYDFKSMRHFENENISFRGLTVSYFNIRM